MTSSCYVDFLSLYISIISLWPSDAMAQVTAWCPTDPSNYLKQCWHPSQGNCTENARDMLVNVFIWNNFYIYFCACQWVNNGQRPVSLRIFCPQFKFDGNFALLLFRCQPSDRNKFWHMHVTCTKFCSDHWIRIEVRVKRDFHRIWVARKNRLWNEAQDLVLTSLWLTRRSKKMFW